MVAQIQDYGFEKCFRTERKILDICGFYPKYNMKVSSWTFLRAFICTLITALQFASMLLLIYFDGLNKLMEDAGFFLTQTSLISKLLQFLINGNMLLDLQNNLKSPILCNFGESSLSNIKKSLSITKNVGRVYRYLATSYSIVSFFSIFKKERNLPLVGWVPFDLNENILYYPTHVLQVATVLISSSVNTSMDIINYLLITIVCCQFDIITEELKAIDFNDLGGEKKLKRVIRRHIEILSFSKKIDTMYTNIVLIQCTSSVLIICLIGLQFLTTPLGSSKFVTSFTFLFTMFLQIANYCWFGHKVMIKSTDVGDACYATNWNDAETKLQRMLCIIMERSKRPVTFTAGGFLTLSLTTLTKIMKSSYSYFAVLQQVYES